MEKDKSETVSVFSDIGTESGKYSFEHTEELLKKAAAGVTEKGSTNFATELKNKIDGTDLPSYRSVFGSTKDEQKQAEHKFGRLIVDGISTIFANGGEVLTAIIKTNFPIHSYLKVVQEENHDFEAEINELMSADFDDMVLEPNEKIINLKADIALKDKTAELYDRYNQLYTQNWSVTGSTNKKKSKNAKAKASIKEDIKDDEDEESNQEREALVFESSTEFQQYVKEVKMFKAKNDDAAQREFVSKYDSYELYVANRSIRKRQIDVKKSHLAKESIVQCVYNGYHMAVVRVANKIKNAVKDCSAVVDKLRGRVVIECTKESMSDPYSALNTTGMYQILLNTYAKPSLGMFNSQLLDITTYEESLAVCNSDPMKVVTSIESHFKIWNQLDLFAYMTRDKFFLVMMLRFMHAKSDLRRQATAHVVEAINKKESGGVGEKDSDAIEKENRDMPMYTELINWLSKEYTTTQDLTANISREKVKDPSKTESKNTSIMYGKRQAGGESAAAASENDEHKYVSGVYDREVLRNEMLHVKNVSTGRVHLYTATANVCVKCSDVDRTKKHSFPACFIGLCHKCKLAGHASRDCHQNVKGNSAAHAAVDGIDEAS